MLLLQAIQLGVSPMSYLMAALWISLLSQSETHIQTWGYSILKRFVVLH